MSIKVGVASTLLTSSTFNELHFKTLDYKLLSNQYTLTDEVLGQGKFGKVLLGVSTANRDLTVAVKRIPKKRAGKELHKVRQEIKILSLLDHPNICRYFETYESPKHLHLVLEHC